jgi:cyclohexanone monooxygenase
MTARDYAVPDYQTVIVGAGFSGIGTAIQLDRSGLSDYLIAEAGDEPGGTWYWNTYPGIAVDIPSFSYQFSFEQSTAWSRTYAPGNELQAYAAHCVNKYGLRSRIRFGTKVLRADFDDAQDFWRVRLDAGSGPETVTARFLINASGVLTVPNLPDITGVDSFAGSNSGEHHPTLARDQSQHRDCGVAHTSVYTADRTGAHQCADRADSTRISVGTGSR